jgi:hypothetical protein
MESTVPERGRGAHDIFLEPLGEGNPGNLEEANKFRVGNDFFPLAREGDEGDEEVIPISLLLLHCFAFSLSLQDTSYRR